MPTLTRLDALRYRPPLNVLHGVSSIPAIRLDVPPTPENLVTTLVCNVLWSSAGTLGRAPERSVIRRFLLSTCPLVLGNDRYLLFMLKNAVPMFPLPRTLRTGLSHPSGLLLNASVTIPPFLGCGPNGMMTALRGLMAMFPLIRPLECPLI